MITGVPPIMSAVEAIYLLMVTEYSKSPSAYQVYFCSELLPTSALDLISQFAQFRHHFITMVALNLDIPILDSAARAAQLLELLCQRGQFYLASHHPINHCYGFSSAPFTVTHYTYNAITLLCRSRLRRFVATALFIW